RGCRRRFRWSKGSFPAASKGRIRIAMPQFSGHWYSGRDARLVFVEAALVGVALSISGHQARGWRELAALVAAAGCVPAALYLADLYDPQVMRNDRTRGANVLKALGFAALAAAIF